MSGFNADNFEECFTTISSGMNKLLAAIKKEVSGFCIESIVDQNVGEKISDIDIDGVVSDMVSDAITDIDIEDKATDLLGEAIAAALPTESKIGSMVEDKIDEAVGVADVESEVLRAVEAEVKKHCEDFDPTSVMLDVITGIMESRMPEVIASVTEVIARKIEIKVMESMRPRKLTFWEKLKSLFGV